MAGQLHGLVLAFWQKKKKNKKKKKKRKRKRKKNTTKHISGRESTRAGANGSFGIATGLGNGRANVSSLRDASPRIPEYIQKCFSKTRQIATRVQTRTELFSDSTRCLRFVRSFSSCVAS